MKKNLLVILITFNNEKVIKKCLDSIVKQTFNDFTLLIIDNNSTDGTIKTIKSYFLSHSELENKTELLKNSQNIGFAKAVNIGFKKALSEKYKAVLLINPDTYFDKYLFKNGIETLFLEKDIGACCPKILYPNGRIWWMGTKLFSTKEIYYGLNYGISKHINQGEKDSFKKGIFESSLLTGCALFIKTEAIQKIGLFDESYFMYVEDVDYALRLKKFGYKLYLINKHEVYHAKNVEKINILLELRREIICLNSIIKYILRHYSFYIFIGWFIKLPLVLGFRLARKIKLRIPYNT